MLKKILPILLMLGFMLAGCSTEVGHDPDKEPVLRALTTSEKEMVVSDNRFGLKLFQALSADEQNSSVFISPLSVSMALGMTLNGADGTTYEAMAATLEKVGLSETEINVSYRGLIDLLSELDPKVAFQIANSIWYRAGFAVESDFLDAGRQYFDAEVRELDFSTPDASDAINDWVDEKTEGKIDKIVDQIGANVVMYLLNAIYFKGTWTYEFDKDDTRDESFRNTDGTTTMVPMMTLEGTFPVHQAETFYRHRSSVRRLPL